MKYIGMTLRYHLDIGHVLYTCKNQCEGPLLHSHTQNDKVWKSPKEYFKEADQTKYNLEVMTS